MVLSISNWFEPSTDKRIVLGKVLKNKFVYIFGNFHCSRKPPAGNTQTHSDDAIDWSVQVKRYFNHFHFKLWIHPFSN